MSVLGNALGGKGAGRLALTQAQAYQDTAQQQLDALWRARQSSVMPMIQVGGTAALQNAYTLPPETLESWFSRLERRANALLDAGDFMDTVEWMQWRAELDGWRDKLEASPKNP